MRRFVTMLLALVFSWAFLRAPFQHVHYHDSGFARIGGLWHIHLQARPAQGVSLEEPSPYHDSRLDWFNHAQGRIDGFYANPVQVQVRSTLSSIAVAWVVPTLTPRAHDPPLASPLV